MKKLNASLIVYALLALMVAAFLFCYTVPATDRALVLRLGRLQQDSFGKVDVMEPGLHFKWPLVTNIKYFDARILKECFFGICPKNARIEARKNSNYITPSRSGEGAVLDACLKIKNKFF